MKCENSNVISFSTPPASATSILLRKFRQSIGRKFNGMPRSKLSTLLHGRSPCLRASRVLISMKTGSSAKSTCPSWKAIVSTNPPKMDRISSHCASCSSGVMGLSSNCLRPRTYGDIKTGTSFNPFTCRANRSINRVTPSSCSWISWVMYQPPKAVRAPYLRATSSVKRKFSSTSFSGRPSCQKRPES